MQFTLASLLLGTDIATLSNVSLDMGEGLGLTGEKSTPLEVPCRSTSFYFLCTAKLVLDVIDLINFYGNY